MRSYAQHTLVLLACPLALLLTHLAAVGQQPPPEPLAPPGLSPLQGRAKNEWSVPNPMEFHIDLDLGKAFSAIPPGLRKSVVTEMMVDLLKVHSHQAIVDAVKHSLTGPADPVAVDVAASNPEPGGLLLAAPLGLTVDGVRSIDGSRILRKGEVDVQLRLDSPDSDSTKGLYRVRLSLRILPTPTRAQCANIIRLIRTKVADDLPGFSQRFLKQELTWGEKREAELNRLQVARDIALLSPAKVEEQLAAFGQQQTAARLALVGMDARAKALAEEIKRTESQARDHAQSDEVLVSLARLLALREQQVERMKALQVRNSVTQQEVQNAEADMLSAKIEYAKRREALLRANGGDRLNALNDELGHLSIERAETTARLKYLEETSSAMAQASQYMSDVYGDKGSAADRLRNGIAEVERTDRKSKELRQLKTIQGMTFGPVRVALPPEEAEAAGEGNK